MKRLIYILLLVLFINTSAQLNEFRGVWLTNVDSNVLFSDDNIVEAMDYLRSIGINVVFPVVYNKGYTLYPSAIMDSLFNEPVLPNSSFGNRDFLERLIIEAHRNGIEVIPWFEFGFSSSYSLNGGHIVEKFPHWATLNNQGELVVKNGFDWLSGINPEVQDFMLGLMLEVIDKYDVDGVQGDDRLPAMPTEGGYDSVTVSIYKSEHFGSEPPAQFSNTTWRRWRADKLNEFLGRVRDSVKARGDYLILSSSPTVFPWGYNEYLQDSKTWAAEGLVDNIVPQLYRQSLSSYRTELSNSLNQVGNGNREIYFAGVLAKVGSYVVTPTLLNDMIAENRSRQVWGECFFFYEALRANGNENGEILKDGPYSRPALLPYRKGEAFRPVADIVNEDSSLVNVIGEWEEYPQKGFEGMILRTDEAENYRAIEYYVDVSTPAYYDVYTFRTPNTPWTDVANYKVYSSDDSTTVIVDQSDLSKKGWHKLATVNLESGKQKVVKVDNENNENGKYLVSDAVMIMINRKLSPDVVVSVKEETNNVINTPASFSISQNYPNPFNPSTIIEYNLNEAEHVNIRVFGSLGREVKQLMNNQQPAGRYKIQFDGSGLSSGVYMLKINAGSHSDSIKMLLLK